MKHIFHIAIAAYIATIVFVAVSLITMSLNYQHIACEGVTQ